MMMMMMMMMKNINTNWEKKYFIVLETRQPNRLKKSVTFLCTDTFSLRLSYMDEQPLKGYSPVPSVFTSKIFTLCL